MTRAGFAASALLALLPLTAIAACSSKDDSCTGPPSGTFLLQVGDPQPVAAAIECEGGSGAPVACSSEPPPFDTATWNVAVDGATATLTAGDGGGLAWSCQVTPPSSPGCYLLLACGPEPLGDAGPGDLQVELLASGPNDVIVLVHQVTGECCAFSYTGTWLQ